MNIYESGEDYLETILILSQRQDKVISLDIAKYLNYSKPSISRAVKNLKENNYIVVGQDGAITLTKKGKDIAEKVYERHLLLSKLFIELGVDEEIALKDACKVEHDLSEETFNAIKKHIKKN